MNSRDHAQVLAVVQARMSSSRLPGKMMTDIGGASALERVMARLRGAGSLAGIVLATSMAPSDDPVAACGKDFGVAVHRGSLDDVLGRYVGALEGTGAGAVVRITGDCPFVDPGLVDQLVWLWRNGSADYVADVIEPRSFPKGLDVEVVSVAALRTAHEEATAPADREHVTKWVRERPSRFAQKGLWLEPPMPEVRVTLDTSEDLETLRTLVKRLGSTPSLNDLILALGGPANPRLTTQPPR